MISTQPVESFGELAERFPGIDELNPQALGRFAFHAARYFPAEAVEYRETGEPRAEWQDEVVEVLREVRSWRDGSIGHAGTRAELAQRITRRAIKDQEIGQVREALEAANANDGYQLVTDFLNEGGYQVQTFMTPSPLFPEGRLARTDIQTYDDPDSGDKSFQIPYHAKIVDNDGNELDGDIVEYMRSGHRHQQSLEKINAALEELEPIDMEQFEELRSQYGAKAAGLICFDEKVRYLKEQLKHNGLAIDITIPPFKAVGREVYEAWLNESPDYEDMLEQIRLEVADFEQDIHGNSAGVVAIRSSALKSEDGDEHTGAGVYKSVGVDPRDREAFKKAVEEVYASARSEAALTYQADIGVSDELMGLVIQRYQETRADTHRDKLFYGHANSTGTNPNIVDIYTNEGILLYDKNALLAQFMIHERSSSYSSELLHSYPDHNTSLREGVQQTGTVPHAVVLAERLFGKPMQVEFVNDAIVQVRPLQVAEADNSITFPEDLDPIGECAASGVGDMELEKLDERDDNSDKKGFVVFWQEYGYTISGSLAGYHTFPKEGAVIIMAPSSSGHIQALCREKGLLCFYPKKGSTIDHLEDYVWDDEDRFNEEPKQIKLRFIADGYHGKIYKL